MIIWSVDVSDHIRRLTGPQNSHPNSSQEATSTSIPFIIVIGDYHNFQMQFNYSTHLHTRILIIYLYMHTSTTGYILHQRFRDNHNFRHGEAAGGPDFSKAPSWMAAEALNTTCWGGVFVLAWASHPKQVAFLKSRGPGCCNSKAANCGKNHWVLGSPILNYTYVLWWSMMWEINGTKLWVLDMMFYLFYPIWFSSFYDQSRIPDWPKHGGVDPQEWSSLPLSQSLGSMIWSHTLCCHTKTHNSIRNLWWALNFHPKSWCSTPARRREPSRVGVAPRISWVGWLPISLMTEETVDKGTNSKQRSTLVCLGALDSLGFLIYTNPIPCHLLIRNTGDFGPWRPCPLLSASPGKRLSSASVW